MKQKKGITQLALALALQLPVASSLQLNITAIGAQDGASTIECWQMDSPFTTSSTPGTSGSAVAALSSVSSLSYTLLPPAYDGGLHNAPAMQ